MGAIMCVSKASVQIPWISSATGASIPGTSRLGKDRGKQHGGNSSCFEWKNEAGACELFVSHLLWKETVERIWKLTFHFRKQTRFLLTSVWQGGRFCLFFAMGAHFLGCTLCSSNSRPQQSCTSNHEPGKWLLSFYLGHVFRKYTAFLL